MTDIQVLLYCLAFGVVIGGGSAIYILGVSGWLEEWIKDIEKFFKKRRKKK